MILVFNVGSSSLKFALYDQKLKEIDRGQEKSFNEIVKRVKKPKAIGHRIVHGGDQYLETTVITEKVYMDLKALSDLAPLHNPPALKVLKLCFDKWPGVLNVAVFDTSYYKDLPTFTKFYAIPFYLTKKYKIQRYGFHGTSHQYVANEASKILNINIDELKLITIHLGAGCSITAHLNGKAYDTSMGFTPLEGLIMASRSGDIDPGILFYLKRVANMELKDLEEILNNKSGLLGISGVSTSFQEVIKESKAEKPSENSYRSGLALKMYAYRVKKYVGAYTAAMGGLDAIVFTGKVGENNELIRNMITNNLNFLGTFEKLVIPTNEELQIAKEVKSKIQL